MKQAGSEGIKINQAVRTDVANSVLCWLATVDSEGIPNVTPKEIFTSYSDDRIIIADIASSNSVRNIRARSAVCVSFVDVFRQKGFKITGKATIVVPEAKDFPCRGCRVVSLGGNGFPDTKYHLDPDRTDLADLGSQLRPFSRPNGK